MPLRRPNLLDAFRRVEIQTPPSGVDPASARTPAAGSGGVNPTGASTNAPAPSATSRQVAPGAPKLGAIPQRVAQPPPTQPARAPAVASEPRTPPSAPSTAAPANTASRASAAPSSTAPTSSAAPSTTSASVSTTAPLVPLRTPPKERVILLALALAVATLVLVLLVRRDDASGAEDSTVQAGAPSAVVPNAAPSAPENPAANAPPPNATPALMPHDAALHDTQNRYTVRLIQYPNDARGLALATEAYHWLVKYGYPVGSPIRLGSGRGIVLCASAKATTEELVPLRDQLQRLRYPESSKTMPFSTAFIDEIDHVLAR